MVGKSKKKKEKSSKKKTHIAAALVPTTPFVAVPRTPPPHDADPEYTSGPLASGLLSSTMLGRLFAQPDPDDNDVDTSLDDYSHARNLSLEDRERMPTPRDYLAYDVAGGYSSARYEDDDEEDPMYSTADRLRGFHSAPLYAEPTKRKSRPASEDEDQPRPPITLAPEEEVVEEVMTADQAQRAESGISQSALDEFDAALAQQKQDTVYATPTRGLNYSAPVPRVERESPRKADTPRTVEFRRQNDVLLQRQEELERRLADHEEKQNRLYEQLERTERSEPGPEQMMEREQVYDQQATVTDNTLRDQSELIKTLQGRIVNLEADQKEHEDMNTELQREIESFRKYVREREGGAASEVTEGIMARRQVHDLKEENDTLKNAIARLNKELSRMQAQYRNVEPLNKNIVGLPSKGPIPSWLINTKYLAPLFLSYDDQLRDKDALISQYQDEMTTFTHRVDEIVKENERLHIRVEQSDVSGPISMTEWSQLQEQGKLVLEENQLLLEQLAIQNEKNKQMNSAHVQEISKLSKRIVMLESDKQDLQLALQEVKDKCSTLQAQIQSSAVQTDMKITLPEHHNVITDIKKRMEEMSLSHQEELMSMTSRLESVQSENRNLGLKLSDLQNEKQHKDVEYGSMKRNYRKLQKKAVTLQRLMEELYDKESSAQHYLSSVVRVAEQTATERDTYAQLIRDQEDERKRSVKEMVQGTALIEQMEQKLKDYKAKASSKLVSVVEKMKDQEESFQRQRFEYERELKQLRVMVNDRDGLVDVARHEKKLVEEELETMWQAASTDNRRLRESMERVFTRLRQHKNLESRWSQDDEIRDLLGYQDTDR